MQCGNKCLSCSDSSNCDSCDPYYTNESCECLIGFFEFN
jgi:hypothetical protein